MAPKTAKGAERKAYMDAYAKGVNKGNRAYGAKKVDAGSAVKAVSPTALTGGDPGGITQGSPGQGSPKEYGKAGRIDNPLAPSKGGTDQKAALSLPGQIALDQKIEAGPPRGGSGQGGTGGIFPGKVR
jgi:hypothetical protein